MGLNPDAVGVGVRDVSDPALRRAGLDGRQAEEADLQPCGGELRQLEAQTHRTDLQHGGRAETRHLQLKTGASVIQTCPTRQVLSLHAYKCISSNSFFSVFTFF